MKTSLLGKSIYLRIGQLNIAILLYLRVAETVLFLWVMGLIGVRPSLQGQKCIGVRGMFS